MRWCSSPSRSRMAVPEAAQLPSTSRPVRRANSVDHLRREPLRDRSGTGRASVRPQSSQCPVVRVLARAGWLAGAPRGRWRGHGGDPGERRAAAEPEGLEVRERKPADAPKRCCRACRCQCHRRRLCRAPARCRGRRARRSPRAGSWLGGSLHEPESERGEHLVEQLLLVGVELARGLLLQHAEGVDQRLARPAARRSRSVPPRPAAACPASAASACWASPSTSDMKCWFIVPPA